MTDSIQYALPQRKGTWLQNVFVMECDNYACYTQQTVDYESL